MDPTKQPGVDATHRPGPVPSPYWRQTLGLSRNLLLLWGAVTLAVGWFGQSLAFDFFGWPFGNGAAAAWCGTTVPFR